MRFAYIILTVILLGGCASKSDNFLGTVFQTSGATKMREYEKELNDFLLQLGVKLIKRNRELFSKDILFFIS